MREPIASPVSAAGSSLIVIKRLLVDRRWFMVDLDGVGIRVDSRLARFQSRPIN